MKLWLIRHGLTRTGEEKRYHGALDEGLSPNGRAALTRADFAPERVWVSPMLRARQTASILFPEAEQVPIQDLREMDFGTFEGHGWQELEHDVDYRAWVDSGCMLPCPGGEDRAGFSARICTAMEAILRTETDTLVIVAHGGTQMAALERWGEPQRDYYRWQTPCGCGWLLDYNKERDRMAVLQEVSFLR